MAEFVNAWQKEFIPVPATTEKRCQQSSFHSTKMMISSKACILRATTEQNVENQVCCSEKMQKII